MYNFYENFFNTSNIYTKIMLEDKVIEKLSKNKTRKQFYNMLRVLYGKKKDRGHIKEKYKELCKKEKELYSTIMSGLKTIMLEKGML